MFNKKIVSYLYSNADALVISIFAVICLLIFTGHNGIGISPDSISYISTARSIHEHWTMTDFNLKPLVAFPVFYPVFLSMVMFLTGTDIVQSGVVLNCVLLAAVVLLSGRLLNKFHPRSAWYKRIVLLFIVFSPALTEVYSMLWSETLLILLSLIFFLFLEKYLKHSTVKNLVICAVLAGLATVTRYAGITLTGTAGLMILLAPHMDVKKKAGHIGLLSLISFFILFLNLIRNHVLVGSLTGPRQFGHTPLLENIGYYGKTLSDWYPVFNQDHSTSILIGLLVFTVVLLLFLYRAFKGKYYHGQENIAAAFVLVYSIFIVGISTLSHFEGINNRLLVPIFIPSLFALTFWLPGYFSGLRPVAKQASMVLLLGFLLLFQYNATAQLDEMYQDAVTYGVPGYADDSWKKSETANFLAKHPEFLKKGIKVYSNAHDAVYFKTGLHADELPHHIDKEYQEKFYQEKAHYIIWFNSIDDPELIHLSSMYKHRKLLEKYRFGDGWVFLFERKP
ncbi:hypothetical protein DBR11_09950 [Pedobacter sp. HMWF019]|uniref:hypothetical protein n=1 Tax=Pedobacter sp. HMWF019 TaxID=2056856 RepID=UPI000D3BF5E5|nr:hypothetical protein [Pedobacter sp. HMWF019]PTT00440.1 hypothetical protein DBR11_09950 [Pedobacter sp. HMWF019]